MFSLLVVLAIGGCKKKESDSLKIGEPPAVLPPSAEEPAAPRKVCGDTECSPVPRGIKGLSFGMTISDIKNALKVTGLARLDPERISPEASPLAEFGVLLSPEYGAAARVMPGVRVEVKTTLGPEPATCVFDLAVDDKLSRIECTLTGAKSVGEHEATVDAIRERFEKNFGFPRLDSDNAWSWESNEATLELRASQHEILRFESKIEVTNVSVEHINLQKRLQSEANRVFERARAAAERAKEQATRDKAKLYEDNKKAWDRDLLPPPERAR